MITMKKFIYPVAWLAYLMVLAISLLMAIKPGAGIFHRKITLTAQNFTQDANSSLRYHVNLPRVLYPAEKVMVFENGQQLNRKYCNADLESGKSVYETSDANSKGYYIYIYPTQDIDLSSNEMTYLLYHALSFVSHFNGILLSAILLFGSFQFASYAFSARERTQLFSLNGLIKLTDEFFSQIKHTLRYIFTQTQSPWRIRLAKGSKLFLITATSAYALILIEWIFQVTKVSFMGNLNLGQKVAVYLLSGFTLAILGIAINAVLLLAAFLLRPLRIAWLASCLNIAVPTALLTSMVVLWLDSFTYTIFHFGILTSTGLLRMVYGVLVLLIFLGLYRWLLGVQGISRPARLTPNTQKLLSVIVLGLLVISSGLAITQRNIRTVDTNPEQSYPAYVSELPDIILLGSDGLVADHMALYGYERETTPVINELAEISLVAENAFTNANKTHGSLISMLTGKLPTRTRVVSIPDILQGDDPYQHLPGILKNLGYSTAQVGIGIYMDANTWNIQGAFDWVNQRTVNKDIVVKTLRRLGHELPAYFIFTIEERLTNRLLQALHIETIENPFSVGSDAPDWSEDRRRINDLINLLDGTLEPLFVHVHLVETHGPTFEPAIRNYSVGKEQDDDSRLDYYDDSILSYDAYVNMLIEALKSRGTFDQTILILYSDHAQGFGIDERIPLLIHFPADQYQGSITTNVQNLDIAPTILDFLGVPIPAWMDGDSILGFSTQIREPLFTIRSVPLEDSDPSDTDLLTQNPRWLGTNNHRYASLQIVYCQRLYQLDLETMEWSILDVAQHTAPCEEESLLTLAQVEAAAVQFFDSQGYSLTLNP